MGRNSFFRAIPFKNYTKIEGWTRSMDEHDFGEYGNTVKDALLPPYRLLASIHLFSNFIIFNLDILLSPSSKIFSNFITKNLP